jgi:hypothetical protein
VIGKFAVIPGRGTGAMAEFVNENVLPNSVHLKDCNLIILPGNADQIRKYTKNIVWCHVPSYKMPIRVSKYFFDPEVENLIGTSLAHYFLNTIPNLMIIPCFQMPLQTEFNLFEVSSREIQTVLPGQELHVVYQSRRDIRTCHLTEKNNKILAELVCANLKPGIFTTEYTNFCFENISLDSILKPL